MSDAPRIERIRHELKRRTLTVVRTERIAPQMVRVVFHGEDLRDFVTLGFDDHIKLFFPSAEGEAAMRDYTPRRFDARAHELWIDFFLHEAGPATSWAGRAQSGQTLEMGGPKGSTVIALDGIDAHVFIGDETALPAISRRLEELPSSARAIAVLEIDGGSAWPAPASAAALEVTRVERNAVTDTPAEELIARLRTLTFPGERCFLWVALESQAARAVRRYLREERGIGKDWIKAAAYWKRGAPGAHDRIGDDD
jgi:NADPH-dependent ferric siderophore reductase